MRPAGSGVPARARRAPVPRATTAWVDTLPPVPQSYIDVPVRYDLASAMRWLESEVPQRFGDLEDRRPVADKNGSSTPSPPFARRSA